MGRLGIAMFVATLTVLAGPAGAATLLTDALSGGTSGQQSGGSFVDGGWQAPHQIAWDLGATVVEGGFSVTLTNWDPNDDSPQHLYDKQHIINLYEAAHGSPHSSDADSPKTSFINIRTGASYDNCFKMLSSPAGFTERIETRVKKDHGTFTAAGTTTIGLAWSKAGDVTVSIDGVPQVTHQHGKALALRYVFIGTDNAPAGTYGPQQGVVYRDVSVWGETGEPGEVEPPPPPPGVFSPDADTWAEPLNPTAVHGGDPELRTGGDGRTIYLRFTVSAVGSVKSALLHLTTTNGGGGGEVRRVADTGWSEATLSYANRPAVDPAVLDALGLVDIGETYVLDVSAAVKQDGVYSFAIVSSQEDGSAYHSREAGEPGPRLEVTAGEPGPDPPPPVPNSCEGVCGGTALSGCQCFSPCLETGTCCKDACAICGECPQTSPDAGGHDAGGWADAGATFDASSLPTDTGGSSSDAGGIVIPVDVDASGDSSADASAPQGGGFSADHPDTTHTVETTEGGCRAAPGRLPGWALPLLLLGYSLCLRFWRRRESQAITNEHGLLPPPNR